MSSSRLWQILVAFLIAVLVATVWGAAVQTLYNMSALVGVGAEFSWGQRPLLILRDIFSGFTPTYGGFVVVPSLLVAFLVAGAISGHDASVYRALEHRRARAFWFALAGAVAILAGIPVVNYLAPVALLVGATRDWSCTILMALGGVLAGFIYVRMTAIVTPHADPQTGTRLPLT